MESFGQPRHDVLSLPTERTVPGHDERSKVLAFLATLLSVLASFHQLGSTKDLFGILLTVRLGVEVFDLNVHDGRSALAE